MPIPVVKRKSHPCCLSRKCFLTSSLFSKIMQKASCSVDDQKCTDFCMTAILIFVLFKPMLISSLGDRSMPDRHILLNVRYLMRTTVNRVCKVVRCKVVPSKFYKVILKVNDGNWCFSVKLNSNLQWNLHWLEIDISALQHRCTEHFR